MRYAYLLNDVDLATGAIEFFLVEIFATPKFTSGSELYLN